MSYMWIHPERGEVEVGDCDEAAAVCRRKMLGKTFARYSREGAKTHPAPKPVTVDINTGRHQWILNDVRAWDVTRPGPGDHGGLGSHAYRQAALVRGLADAPSVDEVIAAAKKNAS